MRATTVHLGSPSLRARAAAWLAFVLVMLVALASLSLLLSAWQETRDEFLDVRERILRLRSARQEPAILLQTVAALRQNLSGLGLLPGDTPEGAFQALEQTMSDLLVPFPLSVTSRTRLPETNNGGLTILRSELAFSIPSPALQALFQRIEASQNLLLEEIELQRQTDGLVKVRIVIAGYWIRPS